MKHPSLKEERKLWRAGYKIIASLDEVGRGPLAGPVVVAAVIVLDEKIKKLKVKDSKKLSPKERKVLYSLLTGSEKISWATAIVSERVIDRINILEATKLAMVRTVKKLEKKVGWVDYLLLDGNFKINSPIPQKSIIKADETVFSCASASIIAKVTRDRLMLKYHQKYPLYSFDKNKGYPTPEHLKRLRKYGYSKIHRQSFSPVKDLILKNK